MANFALIGAAGFVAARHMKAIAETRNNLVAALDPKDSVGILDQHFPDAHFFVEFERFDRHIDKLRRKGAPVEYVSICSPNYLHDSHIRFGLRSDAHVICEKPLVLNPWNLDALVRLEEETGRRVYNVLQLRLHPMIRELRARTLARTAANPTVRLNVNLAYITSRGRWYHVSWKGDESKSGGIATNIGVHFFDMLQWVFGAVQHSAVHMLTPETAAGYIAFAHADVRWFLSIDERTLPPEARERRLRTYRSIEVDGDQLEFSDGFTDLHTATYQDILGGGGFGLDDARSAISLVHEIRTATVRPVQSDMHQLAFQALTQGR